MLFIFVGICIGSFNDYISDVDNILKRNNLDSTINNYTVTISGKGKVVVDYMIVPREGLNNCVRFCVFTPDWEKKVSLYW